MRKKIVFYFGLVCLLSAFQCDEEYTPDEVVENLNLIEIENSETSFSQGDYMFITTTISNQQITKGGQTINLRDYMFNDQSDLIYELEISKIGSNGEEMPYFITDGQEVEGTLLIQDQVSFFNVISPYNPVNANFSSKIGIKLTEVGNYALKTAITKNGVHIISFDTQSSLGTLIMTTSIANSNEEGIYRFTVE